MNSAGSAALRLHKAFIENGIDSSIISLQTDTIADEKIIYLYKKSRILLLLKSRLLEYRNRRNKKEYGSFSAPIFSTDVSQMEEVKTANVIYLHWVLGVFLNMKNIRQLMQLKKPVIVIMHDMWWITGGCHHSFDCEKYVTKCGNCQILSGNKEKDLSRKGFNSKLRLYSQYSNIHFVSPSKWLYNCAKRSVLTKNKPIYYIPNVLDNQIFKPINKVFAREILNIRTGEIIISFGALAIDSPYKGWRYLKDALSILYQEGIRNLSILIFGGGYHKEEQDEVPFKIRYMGQLKDDYTLSLLYNVADVFVVPSLADNQPTVVMESLSCGTPVVGFDVGGIPDMISHKENGYIAKYRDSQDIAEGIKFCINNKIEGKVLPQFEKNEVVKQHIDLIKSITLNKIKRSIGILQND